MPAKLCTPSTRRTCRTSAPAAHPQGRSPCRCPCSAPTALLCTIRSSMPGSASAPPGSAASEACYNCHGCLLRPSLAWPAKALLSPSTTALVPSWAHNKSQAVILHKAGGTLFVTPRWQLLDSTEFGDSSEGEAEDPS